MYKKYLAPLVLAVAIYSAAVIPANGAAMVLTRWSWQETQAEVDPKGDLAWKTRPFVFEKSTSIPVECGTVEQAQRSFEHLRSLLRE